MHRRQAERRGAPRIAVAATRLADASTTASTAATAAAAAGCGARRQPGRRWAPHIAAAAIGGEERVIELHGAIPRLEVERDHLAAEVHRLAKVGDAHVARGDATALGVNAREVGRIVPQQPRAQRRIL